MFHRGENDMCKRAGLLFNGGWGCEGFQEMMECEGFEEMWRIKKMVGGECEGN